MPDIEARLTSAGDAEVVASAVRPQGLQVWNTDVMTTDLSVDFGNPAEALRPVMIMGAKNGSFTGKVVVGSTLPIKKLKVVPGELKGKEGSIRAANVEVRYGVPWGTYRQVNAGQRRLPTPYATVATRLGALAGKALEEFPVLTPPRDEQQLTFRPDAKEMPSPNGAVVPLWLMVKVPTTVEVGVYTGTVRGKRRARTPL